MNECCQHLYKEAIRELQIRDKRIKELQDECTRLFDPTREFWNQERAKPLVEALENCLIMSPLDPFERGEMIKAALKKYRGEQ